MKNLEFKKPSAIINLINKDGKLCVDILNKGDIIDVIYNNSNEFAEIIGFYVKENKTYIKVNVISDNGPEESIYDLQDVLKLNFNF